VLWASTSTKNPAYPDTLYVEELIGSGNDQHDAQETIEAYQDHGRPEPRLQGSLDEAHRVFEEIEAAGVDYKDVTDTLEREGVEKFSQSYDELMSALQTKREALAVA
jgi:transaldolase